MITIYPPQYLPGRTLPSNVVAVPDIVTAAADADFLIFVLPHQVHLASSVMCTASSVLCTMQCIQCAVYSVYSVFTAVYSVCSLQCIQCAVSLFQFIKRACAPLQGKLKATAQVREGETQDSWRKRWRTFTMSLSTGEPSPCHCQPAPCRVCPW